MGTVEVLQGFFKCGASAAFVVADNGMILGEEYKDPDLSVNGIPEAVAKALAVVTEAYEGFGKGVLERQQVHFGKYQLHIEALNGKRNLVLVLGAKANLGRIRLEIRKSKTVLENEIDL
ncbi:MAG: hypothetical protein Q4F00_11235 [bacterium]|nr:hypothetical protein [bacterium]